MPEDVSELQAITNELESAVRGDLKQQAINFAKARGKYLPGITPEDLENTILTELGAADEAPSATPESPKKAVKKCKGGCC
jgi:hypothetical protein